MRTSRLPLLIFALLASVAISRLLLPVGEGRAVQAPKISLDMNPIGNGYDENTNAMIAGPIDTCLGSDPPGDNANHIHPAHLVINDVEDLVGWQVRLNYDGGRMRPMVANFIPFPDNLRGQGVSFINLPIDPSTGVHREVVSAGAIQPAAPGAQTALLGATYQGFQTAPMSPDTPAKAPADDASYSAPTGGILAQINLQVLPGHTNQPLLAIDLDDDNPNPPGSRTVIFNGTGTTDTNLAEDALFDGFHAEGSACVLPPGVATPPPAGGAGQPGQPGQTPASTNAAPGGGSPVPGATSPSGTRTDEASPDGSATASPTPDGEASGAEDNDDGDGTPVWLLAIVAAVLALAAGGAYAAWRYRSHIPWLRDRFP
jgi:hypothetical protein